MPKQAEPWMDEIREVLDVWGRWQRSLPSPIRGSVSVRYQERTDDDCGDVDDPVAEAAERVMCKVKVSSGRAYAVLSLLHISKLSTRDAAERMGISHARVRELRLVGMVMAATLWGVRNEAGESLTDAA